jgi:hypothetical protein
MTSSQVLQNFSKILVNLENLATEPGSRSGFEDSDPLVGRIPRPKEPDLIGFGFVPCTSCNTQFI